MQIRKCFSIVSRSQNDAYIRIGLSLNTGEYVQLKKSVGLEILEDRTLLKDKDRWREEDFLKVNNFINQRATQNKGWCNKNITTTLRISCTRRNF